MKKVAGYLKALHNYLRTPKGRHDFIDYFRAGMIILTSIFIVMTMVKFVCENL